MLGRVVALSASLFVACPLYAAPLIEGEPTYHGKTLKQWTALTKDVDPKVRRTAMVHLGLGPFGKGAVPVLVAALKDKDVEVSLAAVRALGRVGRDAEKAVPALANIIAERYETHGSEICSNLGQIGSAAVPALTEILKCDQEEIRNAACQALGKLGPDAKDAVPALIAELKNIKSQYHSYAGWALLDISKQFLTPELMEVFRDPEWSRAGIEKINDLDLKDKRSIQILLDALKDPNNDLSRYALVALGRQGQLPKESFPRLIDLLADERFLVRESVSDVLSHIGKPAVPYLVKALEHENEQIRIESQVALDKIRPRTIPELVVALKDGDQEMRLQALCALRSYAPDPRPALDAFNVASKDKDAKIRDRLLGTLDRFEPEKEVIQLLIQAAADSESHVRKWAIYYLRDMGPIAKLALPALTKALRDPDHEVRRGAVQALGEIGAYESATLEALCKAFEDPHALVRREAIEVVGKQGVRAKSALNSLNQAIRTNTGSVRAEAALALWHVERNKNAVPSLVKILSDREFHAGARAHAAYALKDIGPDAKEAIPDLLEALRDSHWRVRDSAMMALATMGPSAKEAVPVLESMFADKEILNTWDIAEALARIGKPAVPSLIKALMTPDHPNRMNYCYSALAAIGPDAKEAIPALTECIYKEADDERELSAETLGMIGPGAKSAIPALIDAIKDRNTKVRRAATVALEAIGPNELSISALCEALNDPDAEVRQNSASALGTFGPVARLAVPRLLELLKDSNPRVRASSALALWRVAKDKQKALAALKEPALQGDPASRVTVGEGLWEVDRDTEGLRLLTAAVLSEGNLGDCGDFFLGRASESSLIRIPAGNALTRFGTEANEIAPDLLNALKHRRGPRINFVASVLSKIDVKNVEQGGDSNEVLTQAFEKAYRYYRRPALGAMDHPLRCGTSLSRSREPRDDLTDENDDIDEKTGTILIPRRFRPMDAKPDAK